MIISLINHRHYKNSKLKFNLLDFCAEAVTTPNTK
jgi:hypothetical protein